MTPLLRKYWAWTAPKFKGNSRALTLSELARYRPFAWTDKHFVHNYIDHYEKWFSPLRDKPVKVLEVGIEHGPSIALWDEYFYNNRGIYGIDPIITKQARKFSEGRPNVHLLQGKSDDPKILDQLDELDIIIDDAGFKAHPWDLQRVTFDCWFPKLKPGGIYIIEDFQPGDDLQTAAQPFLDLWANSELIDGRRYKNRYDNNMIVYRK